MEDGSEKPTGFASRTLTAAEKGYSQLDKEGLAIVFAVKHFHQYLYGRVFKIYTDHKPLMSLFSEMRCSLFIGKFVTDTCKGRPGQAVNSERPRAVQSKDLSVAGLAQGG